MRQIKYLKFFLSIFLFCDITAQTVVKMDMPMQADQALSVVALFEEKIPEGIPVVLGLMGYDIKGGVSPFLFEWVLNGEVISSNDIVIFTPNKGDDLSLDVIDNNSCRATTSFNLKMARIPQNPKEEGDGTIQVYPTIADHYIYIKLPQLEQEDALVRIFDPQGKIAYQQGTKESKRINLNLKPGIYYVSVRIANMHKVEKILIQ